MIHVVVGPPAAGKSSFVEVHAAVGVPRFDFDRVAAVVGGMDFGHDRPAAVDEVVLAMRRGLLGWVLDPEVTPLGDVWVIVSNPPEGLVDRFVAAGAVFHLVDPGKEQVIAQAQADGRPQATFDGIERWYAAPPKLPDGQKGYSQVQKQFDIEVKAAEAEDDVGVITAYASVFGNKDSYGDVIVRGAFAESLKQWSQSGRKLPLLYGHDFEDPFSNIGTVTKAVEDDHGLLITAQLDLDNPKARQVYRLLKERRLSQMSFAFSTEVATWKEDEDGEYRVIEQLKLYEVSVVPIGANPETEVLTVKQSVNAEKRSTIVPTISPAQVRALRAQMMILEGAK